MRLEPETNTSDLEAEFGSNLTGGEMRLERVSAEFSGMRLEGLEVLGLGHGGECSRS